MSITNYGGRLVELSDLVIDVSDDDNASGIVQADEFSQFESLMLVAPGTLTGAITVAVLEAASMDETADASYSTYQETSGTDLTIATGAAVRFFPPPAPAFRLESAGTEGGDRTFKLFGLRPR